MKKKVYAYLHTHWDREWYREFEEFRLRLIEVFDDVLKKLESNEIPAFYFDGQTAALEDYLEIKPEKEEVVKNFIKSKKIYIGPYFCSTDSFLVDAESLIKNLQLGFAYSKSLDNKNYIAYHADTFGHSAYLPEIIKYFGIKNAIFWRGLGELSSEFLFKGLKSTYLIEGYFHDYFSADVSYEQKAKMIKRTLDRIAQYSSNNILLPLGADHLKLPDNIKEQIKEINKMLDSYEIVLSTPFCYLKKVEKNYKININNEFRDCKRNFILPGVLSSRIDLKQKNTRLQWQITRITQPLLAISNVLGLDKNFQNNIEYLHKELIKNHAHDSIYGCSVDNVHETNIYRYNKVQEGLNAINNTIKRDLYDDKKLSIINLANYEFNGALKIETNKILPKEYNAQLVSTKKGFPLTRLYRINETPITEDYTNLYEYLIDIKNIMPFSVKTINTTDINKTQTLKITEKTLENDNVKLTIKNNKIEILDKHKNQIYKDFIKIIDRADIGDSYNFGALKNDKPIQAKIIQSKIKEKGHIRSILEILMELDIPKNSYDNCRSKLTTKQQIKIEAILENQNDYIEFVLYWKNKSKNHLLQVEFATHNPIRETITDDLCGYTKRDFDANYNIYNQIPAPRGIELKYNAAPLQKCIHTQGIGLITEGLHEYEITDNKLRLTILRATGTISNAKNPTRGTPAGPPIETPNLQMLKENTARFAVSLKDNIENLQANVEKFYKSTLLLEAKLPNTKIITVNDKNIIVSTMKLNKYNDLIIRFLNKSDKTRLLKFKTNIKYKKIYELNATEETKKEFTPQIDANSFKTIIIKR